MLIMMLAAAIAVQTVTPLAVPYIVVEGSGSARTPPNVAEIEYEIEGEGKTSDQAVRALGSKSAAVEDALRSMDPSLTSQSRTVRVEAVRQQGCEKDSDDEAARLSTGNCAVVGYVATQDFSVKSTRVADAGTMVGLASRQGASKPKIESFDLVDPRAARQQAIAAALVDARMKAEAVAAGSNSRIGDVISIALDAARANEIVVTGTLRQANVMETGAPVPVSVTPGPVVTNASVTVTYTILR